MLKKSANLHILVLCLLITCSHKALCDTRLKVERELRVVFLANFARFTVFPQELKQKDLVLCGLEASPMYPFLETLDGVAVDHDVKLEVRPLKDNFPSDCKLAYFNSTNEYKKFVNTPVKERRGVLTIVFGKEAGMIRLYKGADTLQFDVDLRASREAGIRLRSQLVDVAKTVYK